MMPSLFQRLAPSISSTLLSIWDVSVEALEAGELEGLFNLSLLTAVIQTSPVFLLFLLPKSREQLFDLAAGSSILGGTIFLLVLFGSMSYIIVVGVLNIVDPGWSGASWLNLSPIGSNGNIALHLSCAVLNMVVERTFCFSLLVTFYFGCYSTVATCPSTSTIIRSWRESCLHTYTLERAPWPSRCDALVSGSVQCTHRPSHRLEVSGRLELLSSW